MSSAIPKPPVSLDGGCSVIDENQNLYVYTPDALLKLPLKKDGKWKKLSMGKSVKGGVCVGGPKDSFFVIGGTTSDDADGSYTGLQRYSFSEDKWETVQYSTRDFKQRTHHGAVYLKGENAFLVFAGVTNGVAAPSTTTFRLSADEPYTVNSFSANGAVPATDPNLLPWDDHAAALIGTAVDERSIWVFDDGYWRSANTSLAQPLPSSSQARPAMILNDDGSKVLEVFNVGKSPNTVDRYVLVGSDGKPAAPGTRLDKKDDTNDDDHDSNSNSNNSDKNTRAIRSSHRRKRLSHPHLSERASSLSDIPNYDDQHASDQTRNSFSLAQSPDDLVAITGGSQSQPLALFDQNKNGWVDPEQLFLGNSPLSTPSTSSSPTSTAAAATGGGVEKGAIIGAVLGAVFGFLAIVAVIAFCFTRKHRKDDQQAKSQSHLSIQDQGVGSDGENNPQTNPFEGQSVSSVDLLAAGAVGKKDSENAQRGSGAAPDDQTTGLAEKEKSPFRDGVNDEEDSELDEKSGLSRRMTDDNWNDYFQGDEKDGLTHSNISLEESFSTADQSNLSRDGNLDHVPPQLRKGPASTSQVMENPTTAEQAKPMTPRVQTRDAEDDSFEGFEAVAYDDGEEEEPSTYSSRHSWDPLAAGDKKTSVYTNRASNYSSSVYHAARNSGRHSGQPRNSRPLTETSQYTYFAGESITEDYEDSELSETQLQQPGAAQTSVYGQSLHPMGNGQGMIDMSEMTAEQRKSMQKDLSWLDLGQQVQSGR